MVRGAGPDLEANQAFLFVALQLLVVAIPANAVVMAAGGRDVAAGLLGMAYPGQSVPGLAVAFEVLTGRGSFSSVGLPKRQVSNTSVSSRVGGRGR